MRAVIPQKFRLVIMSLLSRSLNEEEIVVNGIRVKNQIKSVVIGNVLC